MNANTEPNCSRMWRILGDWIPSVVRASAVAAMSIFLTACVHLDQFSAQATDFNVQTASAENATLLLNIVRAANRFPMHFTELTTLSGTGTLTRGATLSVPAGVLNGGSSTGSIGPTASVSESPTFNEAVLETQEFYRGMLRPLSIDEVSNYIAEGLPPRLIFTLALYQIQYQQSLSNRFLLFKNNFHRQSTSAAQEDTTAKECKRIAGTVGSGYPCFEAIVNALVMRGLTTEQLASTTNVGPLLNAKSFKNLKWMSNLNQKTYQIVSVDLRSCGGPSKKEGSNVTDGVTTSQASCPEGWKGLSATQKKQLLAGRFLYRVQEASTEKRYCFDPPRNSKKAKRVSTAATKNIPNLVTRIDDVRLPDKYICQYRLPAGSKSLGFSKSLTLEDGYSHFRLVLDSRSTEGIIYYLGEITRCETKLTKCAPVPFVAPKIKVYDDTNKDTLFRVSRTEASRRPSRTESEHGDIAVNWGGRRYSVNMDPKASDRSGEVLRILSQLVALNQAAKDFPAPAVVPIISR